MLSDFKSIAVADASGERVKMALMSGGAVVSEISRDKMAMEIFAESLSELCGGEPGKVEAFALCIGPGSMLSTRVGSCILSTISALTNAELFSWDCMQTAAFALYGGFAGNLNAREKGEFRILAPSRKGFVNVLDFKRGEVALQEEVEIGLAQECGGLAFLLDQRSTVDDRLKGLQRLDLTAKAAALTLLSKPLLAQECKAVPEPKSLSNREYVKWKAQARI